MGFADHFVPHAALDAFTAAVIADGSRNHHPLWTPDGQHLLFLSDRTGEIQLTNGLRRLLKDRPIYGCRIDGVRHDTGNKLGFLKAVGGPVPQARFCPTGGVTESSAPSYLSLPNVGCVGGTWLTPPDALHDKDSTALWVEGVESGRAGSGFAFHREPTATELPPGGPSIVVGAEQSNTSVVYGDRLILKLFRRVETGEQPEAGLAVGALAGLDEAHPRPELPLRALGAEVGAVVERLVAAAADVEDDADVERVALGRLRRAGRAHEEERDVRREEHADDEEQLAHRGKFRAAGQGGQGRTAWNVGRRT